MACVLGRRMQVGIFSAEDLLHVRTHDLLEWPSVHESENGLAPTSARPRSRTPFLSCVSRGPHGGACVMLDEGSRAMAVLDTANAMIHMCRDAVLWSDSSMKPCAPVFSTGCLPRLVAARDRAHVAVLGWSDTRVVLWVAAADERSVLIRWKEPGPRPSAVQFSRDGRHVVVVCPSSGSVDGFCASTGAKVWSWSVAKHLGECTVWDCVPFSVGWAVAVTRPLATSMQVFMVSPEFWREKKKEEKKGDVGVRGSALEDSIADGFLMAVEECATWRGFGFSGRHAYVVVDNMLLQLVAVPSLAERS